MPDPDSFSAIHCTTLTRLFDDGSCSLASQFAVTGLVGGREVRIHRLGGDLVFIAPLTAHTVKLELYPKRFFHERKVNRGSIIDLPMGNSGLDRRFIAEGAPADLVRWIFNEGVCERLRKLKPGHLHIRDEHCCIQIFEGRCQPDDYESVVTLLHEIAVRVETAASEVDKEVLEKSPKLGGPNRPEQDGRVLVAVHAARDQETQHLRELLERRFRRRAKFSIAFILGIIVGFSYLCSLG